MCISMFQSERTFWTINTPGNGADIGYGQAGVWYHQYTLHSNYRDGMCV